MVEIVGTIPAERSDREGERCTSSRNRRVEASRRHRFIPGCRSSRLIRRDNGTMLSSVMFNPQIDPTDSTPLHEQVAAEIRRAIREGDAQSGERLPPARDLAAILGVNNNTVLRALRSLRDEGLVEFRRGRGGPSPAAQPTAMRYSKRPVNS
jgi:DNA-binding transcriptional ArsR family regulator